MSGKATERLPDVSQQLAAQTQADGSSTTVVALDAVSDLLEALRVGDLAKVEHCLHSLGAHRESDIYLKVGQMTRTLHQALHEFRTSLSRESVTMHSTCIPDAADRIEDVIKLTFDAANHTMNLMDQQAEILKQLKSFSATSIGPLSSVPKYTELITRLAAITTEVVTGQAYQDLAGQALRKVVKLVTGLEEQLLSLVQIFGGHDEPQSGEAAGQPNAAPAVDERVNQDEADALLKSFGF